MPRTRRQSQSKKGRVSNCGADYVPHRRTTWGWGRPSPSEVPFADYPSWDRVPVKTLLFLELGTAAAITAGIAYLEELSWRWNIAVFLVTLLIILLPVFCAFMYVLSRVQGSLAGPTKIADYFEFNDAAFARSWSSTKVPLETLSEAYFDQRIELKDDLLETLYHRYDYATMALTWNHAKFFLFHLIPEALWHSTAQDKDQVRDHYDRGNDFYEAFLGETMTYTSGIFRSMEESLTEAQKNKFNNVLTKIQLQPGEKHLDIGCGWGSLVEHAAVHFGSDSTGVTLAEEQTAYCQERLRKAGVEDTARVLCMDYRDIPAGDKYDKITCLEMAEHVGVKLFQTFLRQVSDLLDDDGMFYLQIAGLRRTWQMEDFVWGLFMGKYIFPGADASCPLAWDISQLERAGFEVHSVENIGVHYSATIKRWYDDWLLNREPMVEKYGERIYRVWEWFLAHSVIVAEMGSSTCWQIVCYKNRSAYDRKRFVGEQSFVNDS